MKVLQFAFDGNPANPYLPHNFAAGSWVAYTGTHDNATAIGWWQELSPEQRTQVEAVLGHPVEAPGWQLLRLALASTADLAVVPLQDLMSLGDEARFNRPGTASGNWNWRLQGDLHALDGHFSGLQQLAACYDRGSSGAPQSGTE
jgi:4-alpha-glucanotransferase